MDEKKRPNAAARRTVLSALGASAGIVGVGSVTSSNGAAKSDASAVTIAVRDRAGRTSLTAPGRCALSRDVLAARDLDLGDQCRLGARDAPCGLYTVVATLTGSSSARVGTAGAERLGLEDGTAGVVESDVPHPTYETAAEAAENDEFVERLDDRDAAVLAVIAPHGGWIEYRTDEQATLVADRLAATTWTCAGYNGAGGAFDRWQVPSTAISRRSFPKLDRIADRAFDCAVSFHGFSRSGILVGGRAPLESKRTVRDAIDRATDGVYDVAVADPDADAAYSGTSPDNVVNRLAADGGIQLEQSFAARRDDWRTIANAVADVYEPRLRSDAGECE